MPVQNLAFVSLQIGQTNITTGHTLLQGVLITGSTSMQRKCSCMYNAKKVDAGHVEQGGGFAGLNMLLQRKAMAIEPLLKPGSTHARAFPREFQGR